MNSIAEAFGYLYNHSLLPKPVTIDKVLFHNHNFKKEAS